jgi:adenylate kinase family enzyme
MKKVAIIGSGGSGKSTLAGVLGEMLRLPVYHLDALYWKPGWVPMPTEEWGKFMEQLVSKDKWIIDGNYARTIDIRLNESDTIIYLDYPTYLSLFRLIKRRIQYHGKTRPDMGEDCLERINFQFIRWVSNYRRDKRPEILKKLHEFKHKKAIHILESPKQLNNFLNQLKDGTTIS